jgi:hypothetical protein
MRFITVMPINGKERIINVAAIEQVLPTHDGCRLIFMEPESGALELRNSYGSIRQTLLELTTVG